MKYKFAREFDEAQRRRERELVQFLRWAGLRFLSAREARTHVERVRGTSCLDASDGWWDEFAARPWIGSVHDRRKAGCDGDGLCRLYVEHGTVSPHHVIRRACERLAASGITGH